MAIKASDLSCFFCSLSFTITNQVYIALTNQQTVHIQPLSPFKVTFKAPFTVSIHGPGHFRYFSLLVTVVFTSATYINYM